MIFLIFSQLPESVFRPNFSGKHFPGNQANFVFWLESVFCWPTFLMANKHRKVWKVVFRKPLSGKQTQPKGKILSWKSNQIFLWPESVFCWPTFLMANKYRKVWKMISQKVDSEKQTWPKVVGLDDARMSDLYELPCISTYIKVCVFKIY